MNRALNTPWSRSLVLLAAVLLLSTPPQTQAQKTDKGRSSPAVKAAFRAVVARPSESTVRILHNDEEVALGTIVTADGFIVTKATLLKGGIRCKLKDGRTLTARVIGKEEDHDIALLKINATGLKPIEWRESKMAELGNWVASPGIGPDPVAVGVVSVATRKTSPRDFPRKLPPPDSGFLGVMLKDGEGHPVIDRVTPDSAAAKAGVKSGDTVLSVSGKPVANLEQMILLVQAYKAGEVIKLKIRREEEEMELSIKLGKRPPEELDRGEKMNRMGSELSERRTGFPVILQHDQVIKPSDCGGPLVDLDGKAVGINIARAGRVESYAIPSETVQTVINRLRAGKVAEDRGSELTRTLAGLQSDVKKAADELKLLDQQKPVTPKELQAVEDRREQLNKKLTDLRREIKDAQVELDKVRKDPMKK